MKEHIVTDVVRIIQKGGIGIFPMDTIYGLVGSALNKESVERIYAVRERSPEKPCIILIADPDEVKKFSVRVTNADQKLLKKYWPGPFSLILDCNDTGLEYLHRGTQSLAFRVPDNAALRDFLRLTGPLVAPSANPEGREPATTIEMAKQYFGDAVDFYVDVGEKTGEPSTVIKIEDGHGTILRDGRKKG